MLKTATLTIVIGAVSALFALNANACRWHLPNSRPVP